MPIDFPNQINVQPAIGVEGDFANANPRFFVPAGAGGLVAGPGGCTIGRAVWANFNPDDADGAPAACVNFGSGAITGILHREQQALITAYLAPSGMVIPAGMPLSLFSGGDLLVVNRGTTQALPNQKAYANTLNGGFVFAPAGQAPVTATITGTLTALTSSFVGSIADNVLTVTSVTNGSMTIGQTLGTAGGVAANSQIVGLGSGTGGVGTYYLSIPEQTVAAGAVMSGSYSQLNATVAAAGALGVGSLLTGTGITGVVFITQAASNGSGVGLTGAGATGTYNLSGPSQSVSSSSTTATNAVETKFFARSSGLVGEVVKISDHALG